MNLLDPRIAELDLLTSVSFLIEEREPPELKHLSRGRKRNQIEIPLVVANENGIGQTESPWETLERCGVWTSVA